MPPGSVAETTESLEGGHLLSEAQVTPQTVRTSFEHSEERLLQYELAHHRKAIASSSLSSCVTEVTVRIRSPACRSML